MRQSLDGGPVFRGTKQLTDVVEALPQQSVRSYGVILPGIKGAPHRVKRVGSIVGSAHPFQVCRDRPAIAAGDQSFNPVSDLPILVEPIDIKALHAFMFDYSRSLELIVVRMRLD